MKYVGENDVRDHINYQKTSKIFYSTRFPIMRGTTYVLRTSSGTYGVVTFVTVCKKDLVLSNSKELFGFYRDVKVFFSYIELWVQETFFFSREIFICRGCGKTRSVQALAEPSAASSGTSRLCGTQFENPCLLWPYPLL